MITKTNETTNTVEAMAKWDQLASVRRPETFGFDEERLRTTLPFSPDFVAAMRHPLAEKLTKEQNDIILGNTLIAFHDHTREIEMDGVVPSVTAIALGRLPGAWTGDFRRDALRIGVDECYHALCADEQRESFAAMAKQPPLSFGRQPGLQKLDQLIAQHGPQMAGILQTAFCAVSETLITGTLSVIPSDDRVHPDVRAVFAAHADDESRHHEFYDALFAPFYESLDQKQRELVGANMADMLVGFLTPDVQIEATILQAAGIKKRLAFEMVIDSIRSAEFRAGLLQSAAPTLQMLEKAGAFDTDATEDAFAGLGLI